MKPPSDMTDAELVALAAAFTTKFPDAPFQQDSQGRRVWSDLGLRWNPLADWNHTMQVVDAMRAKGWNCHLHMTTNEHLSTDHAIVVVFCGPFRQLGQVTSKCQIGNERRAILEAAVAAIQTS